MRELTTKDDQGRVKYADRIDGAIVRLFSILQRLSQLIKSLISNAQRERNLHAEGENTALLSRVMQ